MIKKYFADYIFISPSVSPSFIEDGELAVDEITGRVLSVRKNNRQVREGAKGFKTIIIPGFINSHTHTDLTVKPDNETPDIFSKWVVSIVKKRKSFNREIQNSLRLKAFQEIIESGTTLIGDIIDAGSFYDIGNLLSMSKFIPRVKGFIEIRGLEPDYAEQRMNGFKMFCRTHKDIFKRNENYFSLGISPHSVYAVSEVLFEAIRQESLTMGLKTAIHVSEHLSETQFISGTGGDIADNLLPALNLSQFSRPLKTFSTPVAYLNHLKILNKNTLIIHANEINDEDIGIIKDSGANIVHCPRSNAFFNSRKFPLKKVMESGISVSLGTDSLYSNQSLSILDELKYAKEIHPGVSSEDLFAMATVNGARALSFPGVTGTLEPNSRGDFIVFKTDKNVQADETDIYDIILSFKKTDIIKVVLGGDVVYDKLIL